MTTVLQEEIKGNMLYINIHSVVSDDAGLQRRLHKHMYMKHIGPLPCHLGLVYSKRDPKSIILALNLIPTPFS